LILDDDDDDEDDDDKVISGFKIDDVDIIKFESDDDDSDDDDGETIVFDLVSINNLLSFS